MKIAIITFILFLAGVCALKPGKESPNSGTCYKVREIPSTEAEFPGGLQQLTRYYAACLGSHIHETGPSKNIDRALVKFTVNEKGQVENAKISRSTTDPKIDLLLLNATTNMPKWTPAKNRQGRKVKQEFSVSPSGSTGGC
jgi:TonB family protein